MSIITQLLWRLRVSNGYQVSPTGGVRGGREVVVAPVVTATSPTELELERESRDHKQPTKQVFTTEACS